MKIIGIVLSIILFLIPMMVMIGTIVFTPDSCIRVVSIILIGGYIGSKSRDDAKRFYKWFKSKLK